MTSDRKKAATQAWRQANRERLREYEREYSQALPKRFVCPQSAVNFIKRRLPETLGRPCAGGTNEIGRVLIPAIITAWEEWRLQQEAAGKPTHQWDSQNKGDVSLPTCAPSVDPDPARHVPHTRLYTGYGLELITTCAACGMLYPCAVASAEARKNQGRRSPGG